LRLSTKSQAGTIRVRKAECKNIVEERKKGVTWREAEDCLRDAQTDTSRKCRQ